MIPKGELMNHLHEYLWTERMNSTQVLHREHVARMMAGRPPARLWRLPVSLADVLYSISHQDTELLQLLVPAGDSNGALV